MQHFSFCPHFSWAELKDLKLFLCTQKAYFVTLLRGMEWGDEENIQLYLLLIPQTSENPTQEHMETDTWHLTADRNHGDEHTKNRQD